MQPADFSLLKHLDAPVRFLSFTMNEFIAYLTPFFVGAFLDSLVLIPGFGLCLVFGLKRLCRNFPKFHLIRWLYWSIPTKVFRRILRVELPESHQRFLVY